MEKFIPYEKALQKRETKARRPAAQYLGHVEPSNAKTRKFKGLQQTKGTEME